MHDHRLFRSRHPLYFLSHCDRDATSTMGLVDKIRSKLETRRLEQKYARRNNRRTSVPNIEYVAGEYVLSDMTNKRGDINANRSRSKFCSFEHS